MKVLWFLIIVGLGALYYFAGFRIGFMPNTPLYAYNVQGKADYPFEMFGEGTINITGSCKATSGKATLSFTGPDKSIALSAVQCIKGNWSINMSTQGQGGTYHILADYKHFTGQLQLDSTAKVKIQ